jgi:hypothetical protein
MTHKSTTEQQCARFTDIPTDYREYIGVSERELGYGEEAVSGRFIETIENGQCLGIYETLPKDAEGLPKKVEKTILVPASHDYRIEPSWMTRADIIASSADARVVLVDMPGATGLLNATEDGSWKVYESSEKLDGASQTPAQLANAFVGNFLPHAEVQLNAVEHTVGIDPTEELILLGESMGARIVVDMLEILRLRERAVSKVVLYEMVNAFKGYRPSLPFNLMKVLPGIENDRRTAMILENERIGHPLAAFEMNENPWQKELDSARKSLGQQALGAAANGLGMARGGAGRLMTTLRATFPTERPQITMVRGRESMATAPADYIGLEDALRSIGMKPDMYTVSDGAYLETHGEAFPMGHSHNFSLARHRQVSDYLAKH